MADNPGKQKQAPVHKNIHNFSWFPSMLLLFQLFLLLFRLFKFDHEIVDSFNQFLQESSLFLSIINGLLIFWYWKKDTILNQSNISKEYKIINSCICVINIVLLNKIYDNKKINEAFSLVRAFFSGENIAIYIFAFVIIVAVILIVRYTRKADKNDFPGKIPLTNSINNKTATDKAQPQQISTSTTQAPPKDKNVSANVVFFIILMVLFFVIAAVVYVLIVKYDIVANIINDTDRSSRILTYLLLAISVVAFIILSIIIVTATARSISKLILQIPEYICRAEVSDDRMIKIVFGIVLVPVFYGITKLFNISTDWVLDLLQNKDFLVVPFIALLYFVLAMLFVEVLYGLFSGKPRVKWVKNFTRIISDTGDRLLDVCDSIVKSFFRLLKFVPDFLESIQTVLMGEEDAAGNAQSKQNGQNTQGNNKN